MIEFGQLLLGTDTDLYKRGASGFLGLLKPKGDNPREKP